MPGGMRARRVAACMARGWEGIFAWGGMHHTRKTALQDIVIETMLGGKIVKTRLSVVKSYCLLALKQYLHLSQRNTAHIAIFIVARFICTVRIRVKTSVTSFNRSPEIN